MTLGNEHDAFNGLIAPLSRSAAAGTAMLPKLLNSCIWQRSGG